MQILDGRVIMFNYLFNSIFGSENEFLKEHVSSVLKMAKDLRVILMHRRWLIVFEIFCHQYFKDDEIAVSHNIFCDCDCYDLKSSDTVLISDDIIIHGRAVTRVLESLGTKSINATITAFYKNLDATALDESCFEYLNSFCVVTSEWHTLSNKLIKLILQSKIPYTTFTYSFAVNQARIISNSIKEYHIYQPLFEQNGIELIVYFGDPDQYNLLRILGGIPCIRHYTYRNVGRINYEDKVSVYVPFVFISSVSNSVFEVLSSSDKLPISVCRCFSSHDYSNEYKARLLSFILSYAYGIVSIDVEDFDNERMSIIKNIISKSFRHTFDDVLNMCRTDCEDLLSSSIVFKEETSEDEVQPDFCGFMSKGDNTFYGSSVESIITESISYLHDVNENRAERHENSSWGYKIGDIQHTLLELGLDEYNSFAFLCSIWDTGRGAYYFREYRGRVYGCVTDGEQAYKINYQNFAQYANVFFILRNIAIYKKYDLSMLWDKYIQYMSKTMNNQMPPYYMEEMHRSFKFLIDKSEADMCNADIVVSKEITSNLLEGMKGFCSTACENRIV